MTQSVQEIFEALCEVSGEKQQAELLRRCGSDRALRAEVESLLKAHAGAGDFLRAPTVDAPDLAPTCIQQTTSEGPGTVIGPYKLLELIGEGGFGVVYMAQQRVPIHRRVALKIIKAGMDTKQVIARFESERQALAVLDHP